MAFLTENSFRQLILMSEIPDLERIELDFFLKNIYNDKRLFFFFNQFDLKKLFREKAILSDDANYIPTYRKVPDRVDNLNYVLEMKGKVKYHQNSNCSALKKGFKNFFMPESVVRLQEIDADKHRLLVNDIRNWFKINNFTVERYEKGEINDKILTKSFNDIFPLKYQIDPIFISQSNNAANQFHWLITKSTDNIELERVFDYDIFLDTVNELAEKRDRLCYGSTMQSLSKYDYLLKKDDSFIINLISERIREGGLKNVSENFLKNFGLKKLRDFWKEHKNLKDMAYKQISDYFKWTYNLKNKDFDVLYLEDFNLEGCSLCKM
ncbi:MAG: hypothetical protein EOO44_09035 [Flavobacterium sp.]|nr:MAG: hypothetical protein EOO44_09035 [Flavobacterium sp.]